MRNWITWCTRCLDTYLKVRLMKKWLNLLLIINPSCGMGIVVALHAGGWWLLLIPALIALVYGNMRLHFRIFKDEYAEYDKRWKQFKSEHTYVGMDYYGEQWRNNNTGEIVEI